MDTVHDDTQTMVNALRATLAAGDVSNSGQVRTQIEAYLGPETSARLRPQVHQVAVAAEENLPANLTRISPLTSDTLQRLSQELADARGWTPVIAQRTTQLWAYALGFEDLAATSWSRDPAREGPERPGHAAPSNPDLTLLPPEPERLSSQSINQAMEQPPTAGWPKPKKMLARHSTTLEGAPSLGSTLGYDGLGLAPFTIAIVALLVVLLVPVLVVGAAGFLLPVIGIVIAGWLASRQGRGALTASPAGLEFIPYDSRMTAPKPEQVYTASWSEVIAEPGLVTTFRFAGHRVQVGPLNRRFARAATAQVSGSAQ